MALTLPLIFLFGGMGAWKIQKERCCANPVKENF